MSRFYGVKAPHCPPEEANRLRDLWRPGVQEDSVPLIRSGTFGDGEHEFRMIPRPDDYDPTQTSLWAHNPMYVIPPEIAEPLSERLDRHHDEPFFEEHRDWGAGVTHGAKRFYQRFVGEENLRRVFDWAVWTRAEINFDPQSLELRSANDFPVVNVDAPVMERKIPHERLTGWRPAGSPAEEYQPREGILGWTIPHYQIDGESLKPTWSLFRAKNHLVEVSWYMMPAERLSFHFKWPQLSKLGEEMLDAALVELEPLVPEGIDYTERYVYIDSKQEGDLWSRQWTGTKEEDDKFRRQREAAERYRALY